MGFLDHKVLQIIEGVAAIPGDTNTAESPPIVLDLLGNTSGISLVPVDGWSPKIPSIEGSGVWADSPLTPGRQLLVAEEGNVTETMRLIISGSSLLGMIKTLDTLYMLAQDAREFWTDNTQIQPVFLKWWASCGLGPQYALIYNMTIDPKYEDSMTATITATVTIEREPYWRGLPPGSNPKQWYYENVLHQAWNSSTTALVSGTDHLAVASTLRNCLSWTSHNVPSITPNYIDIPAASIPGDAPALAMITIESLTPGDLYNYFIGLSTKPTTLIDRGGAGAIKRCITFNAGDASAGTDFTVANDTGGVKRLATGFESRAEISYATATDARRMLWAGTAANQPMISATLTRGLYAAFLRCRQTAVTTGDVKMYLKYGVATTTMSQTNEVSPVVQAGAGNTTAWPFTYMGIIDVPTFDRMAVDAAGKGLYFSDGGRDFVIELWSRRTAGASLLYVCDLFLFPVDELWAQCIQNDGTPTYMTLDNTGYYGHGDTRDLLIAPATGGNLQENTQLLGTAIQLQPGVINRLHILGYNASGTSPAQSTMAVRVDIIPRWRGVRDV